ncbi:MAG: hypothetical protein LBS17_02050 [Actinomycetes bacterium]|jgi:regulator of protease activity HflC (stomatin/prohibitin superfamily)|nr:hypothetical protein [Actinomycetes bacterium]
MEDIGGLAFACLIPVISVCVLMAIVGLRVVDQYQRGIVLTLGKFSGTKSRGSGGFSRESSV